MNEIHRDAGPLDLSKCLGVRGGGVRDGLERS